jgi:pyruvate dehydrogenase E2 component (dihydrolipoamide acetyltransferase)
MTGNAPMTEFLMPSLGADMDAGTLVEWLVKPGDRVNRGDIIAVVETQKGAIEIETFDTGLIERLLVDLHTKVPVGTPLAVIRSDAELQGVAAHLPHAAASPVSAKLIASVVIPPPAAPPLPPVISAPAPRLRVSPAARRLARERGIDVATIAGTGPRGAIISADIAKLASSAPGERRATGIDLGAMRTAIAAAMARAKREIPHYYLEHAVDVTACQQWLARSNTGRPPEQRLLFGALTLKAVALAARKYKHFNGFFRNGAFYPSSAVHVGMAINIRGGGLAAPALRDADQTALDELMARMRDLIQRMRVGRIRSSEIADATITVSSLGDRGVDALYGVIYPPQVALVGVGKTATRPWVVDGTVVARSVVTLTLAADHRTSDGHAGALFLGEIAKLLQEPEKL